MTATAAMATLARRQWPLQCGRHGQGRRHRHNSRDQEHDEEGGRSRLLEHQGGRLGRSPRLAARYDLRHARCEFDALCAVVRDDVFTNGGATTHYAFAYDELLRASGRAGAHPNARGRGRRRLRHHGQLVQGRHAGVVADQRLRHEVDRRSEEYSAIFGSSRTPKAPTSCAACSSPRSPRVSCEPRTRAGATCQAATMRRAAARRCRSS